MAMSTFADEGANIMISINAKFLKYGGTYLTKD
jgi:hypothetical protein